MEQRRYQRFKLETNIKIYSRTAGHISGQTLDISEFGLAAMLLMEVAVGELIGLDFQSEVGPIHVWAVVRNRRAFRYGLEFVHTPEAREQIKRLCDLLAQQT